MSEGKDALDLILFRYCRDMQTRNKCAPVVLGGLNQDILVSVIGTTSASAYGDMKELGVDVNNAKNFSKIFDALQDIFGEACHARGVDFARAFFADLPGISTTVKSKGHFIDDVLQDTPTLSHDDIVDTPLFRSNGKSLTIVVSTQWSRHIDLAVDHVRNILFPCRALARLNLIIDAWDVDPQTIELQEALQQLGKELKSSVAEQDRVLRVTVKTDSYEERKQAMLTGQKDWE